MPVALGAAVKLADVRVKNPVDLHLVLLMRVAASVPLLNKALLLREGRADAVGTPTLPSTAFDGVVVGTSTPPSTAFDGVVVGALTPSSTAPDGVAAGGVAV